MWKEYNTNPKSARVGDCVIRALTKALNADWDDVYLALAVEGLMLCDMPTANRVWGSYLKKKGYERHIIQSECPECYTVRDFCREYPKGSFILALDGHVVAVHDGDYYDSWDSGNEVPVYYWKEAE